MCECSEKNFWISVGVFALIWGISVQYPFVIDPEIEVPGLYSSISNFLIVSFFFTMKKIIIFEIQFDNKLFFF